MQAMDGIRAAAPGKSGSANESSRPTARRSRTIMRFRVTPRQTGGVRVRQRNDRRHVPDGQLVWVSFGNANRDARPGECDCVTFTGIGLWTKDLGGPHMCTVQISTAPDGQYVSIQIDGGLVSNVNTKPKEAVLPFAGLTLP
jgi:hypothetical protein